MDEYIETAKYHINPKKRKRAIDYITDESVLIEIAKYDSKFFIREKAVKHITDQNALLDIVVNDTNPGIRKIAVGRIHDEKTLLDIVKNENDEVFSYESNWPTEDNLELKKNKYTIKNSLNGTELCWGIGEYSSNAAYFLEYDITNFVTNLSDGNQMINFEFFQNMF